jgi:hypothetical protein
MILATVSNVEGNSCQVKTSIVKEGKGLSPLPRKCRDVHRSLLPDHRLDWLCSRSGVVHNKFRSRKLLCFSAEVVIRRSPRNKLRSDHKQIVGRKPKMV